MKRIFFLCFLVMTGLISSAQFIYKIKADSVLITNDSCNAELNLENGTRNVTGGFLYNKGNGRTEFKKALFKVNDTLYLIGGDSLKIAASSTGSYILNQNSSGQVANYYINGTGSLTGGLSVGAPFNITNTTPNFYNSYKVQIWDSLLVEGTGASQVRFTGNNAFNPGFVFDGSTSNTKIYTLNSQNLITSANGGTYFNNNKVIFYNSAFVEPYQQPLTIKKTYPAGSTFTTLILNNDTSGLASSGLTKANYKILTNKFADTVVSYLSGNGGGVFTEDLTVNTLTIGDGTGTGAQNTALGNQVMGVNTTGTANTGAGYLALKSNTTGSYNVAIGVSSLLLNTIGINNTAVGVNSLQVNTIGQGNTAIGLSAMEKNTEGYGNTAVGWISLAKNTKGHYNTAVGHAALRDSDTTFNSAFGYAAAGYTSVGTYNQGFGAYSLYSNTSGNYNAAYGGNALYYNTTGSSNAGFGTGALYLSTGSNNTGVGVGAGQNLTSGNNNIFIGHNVAAISTTGSNQLNIGGWIYGDNGKIGIGVTAPTAKLHLPAGTTTANTAPLKFTSGTNLTTPENGAVEYDGTNYFATSSSTRYTLAKTLTSTASLNFTSTSAQSSADLTITVTGAADGDAVSLGVPNAAVNNNSNFTAWVSASNTVTVRFNNYSSGSIDPASGTFRVSVVKY